MKVIYEKGIVDKIKESISEAADKCRKIEKIILNPLEWDELNKWQDEHFPHEKTVDYSEVDKCRFMGIPLLKENPVHLVDKLNAYNTYQEAKTAFEDTKRRCHVSGVNNGDMVLQIGNQRIKFTSVGTMQEYDSLVGRYYSEIYFGPNIPKWISDSVKLRCLRYDLISEL